MTAAKLFQAARLLLVEHPGADVNKQPAPPAAQGGFAHFEGAWNIQQCRWK